MRDQDWPVRGEAGTAGLGAELEQSRPILEGGFSPDGLGSEVGRCGADSGGLKAAVAAPFASGGAFSTGGVVDDPTISSWGSLIFVFTLYTLIAAKRALNLFI